MLRPIQIEPFGVLVVMGGRIPTGLALAGGVIIFPSAIHGVRRRAGVRVGSPLAARDAERFVRESAAIAL